MDIHMGLDVFLPGTSVCALGADGPIVAETTAASGRACAVRPGRAARHSAQLRHEARRDVQAGVEGRVSKGDWEDRVRDPATGPTLAARARPELDKIAKRVESLVFSLKQVIPFPPEA